jgi:hypothetical protein
VPVARTEPGRAIAAAIAVAIAAVLLVLVVLFLNSRGTSSGDGRFSDLDAEDLLRRQEADGVPICFNDPISGNRPICVFHSGADPEAGWVAYDAQVDGCAFGALAPGAEELVVSCTGETFPFTGEGLRQYDVEVEDGSVVVDLDGSDGSTTTTSVVESGDVSPG